MAKGSTLKIDIIADASRASTTMDNLGGRVGSFGKNLAKGAALGAAGVVAAGATLAVAAIKSASAVEQAYGATDSVFGKYAASVKNAAEGAAESVGLASSDYANLANVLGAQLKNMGTSADKLAPKTDQLIKQGADLAATFGGTTADAVSAVSSLLKGERDPIERYGVSIKAADIAARLQAKGLDKLKGPALAAAQAQETLAMLTEQTSSAQGAFGRESDTAAGQQQRLTAMWENAKVGLGQGLLPVVTKLATFFTGSVMPAVQGLADTLASKLGPIIGKVSGFVTTQLLPAARDTYTWFVTKLAPAMAANVGPVLAAIGPLVSRLAGFLTTKLIPAGRQLLSWYVDKIVPAFRSILLPVIAGLTSAFDKVRAAVERNRPELEKIGRVLKTVAEFIADKVAPIVGKVLGKAFEYMGTYLGTAIDMIGRMVDGVETAVGWFQKLKDGIDKIKGAGVSGMLDKLNPFGFAAPTAVAPSPVARTLSAGLTGPAAALTSSPGSAPLVAQDIGPVSRQTIVNNYLTVEVNGALDPVAVAEQIRAILLAQAKRTGRPMVVMA